MLSKCVTSGELENITTCRVFHFKKSEYVLHLMTIFKKEMYNTKGSW